MIFSAPSGALLRHVVSIFSILHRRSMWHSVSLMQALWDAQLVYLCCERKTGYDAPPSFPWRRNAVDQEKRPKKYARYKLHDVTVCQPLLVCLHYQAEGAHDRWAVSLPNMTNKREWKEVWCFTLLSRGCSVWVPWIMHAQTTYSVTLVTVAHSLMKEAYIMWRNSIFWAPKVLARM